MKGQGYQVVEPGLIHMNVDQEGDKPPPFPLIPVSQLTEKPTPIRWLIKDYLPEQSITDVFGAPGSCKSFVVFFMAYCIATGLDWYGKTVKQGLVILIIGEGQAGIGMRFKALEMKYGLPADNLIVSTQPANLTDEENSLWVSNAIHQYEPALVIIDTLSRNFGCGDENSTRDMNAFVSNLDNYIKGDAAVLIVHHTGLVNKDRARGSSVLNGAMDTEYCITRSDDLVTMSCTKAKEFEPPKSLSFQMTPQELDWQDEDGEPIKSIVLEETEQKPSIEKSKSRLTGRNEATLAALQRSIEQHGIKPDKEITERFGGFSIGSGRKVVHVDHWRKEAYMVIDVDTNKDKKEAKRSAFNRAKDSLLKNHVQTMNGHWWLIVE